MSTKNRSRNLSVPGAVLAVFLGGLMLVMPSRLPRTGVVEAANVTVQKVVAVGDASPAGGTFASFSDAVSINDAAQVAVRATLSTGSTGIFIASPTANGYAISKVVLAGDANPAGGTFSDEFSSPSLNSTGQIAFSGRATGQSESIFLASPTDAGFSVSLVAPTGLGGPQTPSLNDGGAVAFTAQIGCCTQGLFIATPYLSGFNIAQVAGNGTFETPVSLNDSNHVAFAGCVQFCGAPLAVYFDGSIVVQGNWYTVDKYPGVFAPPSLADTNTLAFRGCVWPCPNLGLLVASPTASGFSFEAVVSLGDPAPSDGTFSSFDLSAESLNSVGQVAFDAYVSGSPGNGVFLAFPTSTAFQIDQVVVAGDLSPLGGTFAGVGSPSLNAVGQVAFWACVSDCGSTTHGIFVASLDTPKPTPTPTVTATPTATPTPSDRSWGDVDCDSQVNAVDALKLLRHSAGLGIAESDQCPYIGTTVTVNGTVGRTWGDVDCSGGVDAVDALKALRFVAGLLFNQAEGCPIIGSTVSVS